MTQTKFVLNYDIAAGRSSRRVALVMLPGAGMRARDFREYGLVEALRERGQGVDAVLVDVDAGEYMSAALGGRLRHEVLEPLQECYRSVWCAGISLGAYGAMRLLQECAEGIAGMLLLSPFLATRGTVARVRDAGGLDGWLPLQAERHSDDTALLCWLKDNLTLGRAFPEIHLGWGMQDRYAEASELLADRLPRDRVFRIHGDHDWPTWLALWHGMLDTLPFLPDTDSRQNDVSQRV